jgi:hypothetical protein
VIKILGNETKTVYVAFSKLPQDNSSTLLFSSQIMNRLQDADDAVDSKYNDI